MQLVSDILWHHEFASREKPAVLCEERFLRFGELGVRVRRLANSLRGLGIRMQDHVAVLSTNSAEHIEIVFALSAIGAVWVPLNTRLVAPELEFIITDSSSSTLIYSSDMIAVVAELRTKISVRNWIEVGSSSSEGIAYEKLIASGADSPIDPFVTGSDRFTVMYTSGTTGLPKGVVLTHRQFLIGTTYLCLGLGVRNGDSLLMVAPQWHAGGQIIQLGHLMMGAQVVILRRFDPELTLRTIAHAHITAAGLVPAMIAAMLETPQLERTDFSALRKVMYGGSPIAEDRLARAMEVMGVGFQQTYGQTEAGVMVTVLDEADHLMGLTTNSQILRSCGRQMVGYTAKLVDDHGKEVSIGEPGELIVKGESVTSGYWRRPEATQKVLRDGWLYTGDVAYADELGRFYLIDRKVDMVVSGGENLYPIEIEHVISSHPDVLDVAVIGVPDDRWGRRSRRSS
ncbi:AMP-binding protein [Tardiphaga robiniae]|uniref:AMP-binding protein n=1 Tax=Tardiphaga robiniae TaxID=943830 RepID=A0A7G6U930_9BRAD|nr:AMP-binding protein [Tardiphaga robiniae]QND75512.1 AMP-binding protein [Tardiphaga robiniae]